MSDGHRIFVDGTLAGLFEHNNWANLGLVAACASLTHLVQAQAGYLSLLTLPPEERVRASLSFGELRASLIHSGGGLLALARSETREQAPATTRIETTDGYLVERWVVLVQVLNHATDHRRQACELLRALGAALPRSAGSAIMSSDRDGGQESPRCPTTRRPDRLDATSGGRHAREFRHPPHEHRPDRPALDR